MLRLVTIAILAAGAFGGCSGTRDPRSILGPGGAGTIVVDSRWIVGHLFPVIDLTTTASTDEPYSRGPRLHGADVIVTTGDRDTIWYQDNPDGYDWYRHTGFVHHVQPRTTYMLHVRAADGRIVTAQTTTPDTFQVREWLLVDALTLSARRPLATPEYPYLTFPYAFESYVNYDSVYTTPSNQLVYQDGLVEARFERGNAIAFQMALFNLEDDSPLLLDADFVNASDLAKLDRSSSSPPLDAPDGYVRLPWAAVWYQGRHAFAVYSVDRNWYDIARSVRFYAPQGLGFGTNAGDDFEKPIFHVQGGIGLFGSAAMDWTGFTVSPRTTSTAMRPPAPIR